MKLLFFSLLISSVFAARDYDKLRVHKIDSIEYQGQMAVIELENSGKTYKISKDHKSMPCLWNGWIAPQEVVLGIDEESGKILECKLYASGVPHLKNIKKRDI